MNKKFFFILFLFGLGSFSAQSFVKPSYSFNPNPNSVKNNDSLKILAVLVDFQLDKYDGTIGTGKFGSHYSKVYGDTILDPLPHDAAYFADHLQFAKNYFSKVSKGKLNITYNVLPQLITVSKMMRDYVPEYNSSNLSPLGNFANEVWQFADQKFPNVKFSDYDLFIIFHAGVSNALAEGAGIVNRNMPSIYLSNAALKKIFGNSFQGFPVDNNTNFIGNTILMPETETREITSVDESVFLLELSINGLLVGNIASHLGLPDLFNTDTSTSAIGLFGLMDSQAFFANSGMFPPEPSPWEKIFLGWESPAIFGLSSKKINLSTRYSALANDTTLFKVPINSNEYFLLENRAQDAGKDNVIVTYRQNGQTFTKAIEPDTSGLFTIKRDFKKGIPGGVVIDVDEFDASIPGNGIVIWHIDEKVISGKISRNKINTDPSRRGVDVEEADGIQDIGEKFSSPFGDIIGEGGSEDFWFKKNSSRLYKNKFSSDSKPNTKTNDGTNSLISIENFSDLSNKMSFTVSVGNNDLYLARSIKIPFDKKPTSISSLQFGSKNYYYILNDSDLLRYNDFTNTSSTIGNFSTFKPAVINLGNDEFIVGGKENGIKIFSNINNIERIEFHYTSSNITSPPVSINFGGQVKSLIGTANGTLYEINLYDFISSNHSRGIKTYTFGQKPINQIAAFEDYFSLITDFTLYDSKGISIPFVNKTKQLILTKNSSGVLTNIVLHENGFISIIENGTVKKTFHVTAQNIESIALADLFGNAENYILFNAKNSIYAYSLEGFIAENFPITINNDNLLFGTPLAVDLGNDSKTEILSFSRSGNIYAFSLPDGKLISSFPLGVGDGDYFIPAMFKEELPTMGPIARYKPILPVLSNSNQLNLWSIASIQGNEYWTSQFGTQTNSSYVKEADVKNIISQYFPEERAYNWPNPVYGIQTNIRYFVSEDSDIKIRIFDLAGDLVADLENKASGGFDNETVWNVEKIMSGVYYARIEVKSISGKTASKLIKIAVIK